MSTDLFAPKAKLEGRCLVRDKHGRPKFDDPSKIKAFLPDLSEEDILFLKEKFNDYFRTN